MTTYEDHQIDALRKGWTNLWADLPWEDESRPCLLVKLADRTDKPAPVIKVIYDTEGQVELGDLFDSGVRVWLDTIDPTSTVEEKNAQVLGWIENPPEEQTETAKRILGRVPREQYEMLMLGNYLLSVTIQEARREAGR